MPLEFEFVVPPSGGIAKRKKGNKNSRHRLKAELRTNGQNHEQLDRRTL